MIKTIKILILTFFVYGCGQVTDKKIIESTVVNSFDCSKLNINKINQIDNKFILSLPRPDKNSGEPDLDKLTLVDSNFYNKYIKPNKGLFQEWNPNDIDGKILNSDEDYANIWTSRHYFFGKIELPDNLCRIIIYEYFIVNHSENKLFMIVIDKLGNLLYVDKVAESTDYPGAYYYEYSILSNNNLINYQVTDDYLSNYDEEKEEPISPVRAKLRLVCTIFCKLSLQ